MHYRDLEIAHKAFYVIESRAHFYDNYMKNKKSEEWADEVPISEVERLFKFIRSWDVHFEGNEGKFQQIYREIAPDIAFLGTKTLENVELDDERVERSIERTFDKVATLSSQRYQATDCSKILHTILPNLIVMWDREIRGGILGSPDKNWGKAYVWEFLPKMQEEAKEAIATFVQLTSLTLEGATKTIEKDCGQTLAKLVDEHNYVVFTRTKKFELYLRKSVNQHEITSEECSRLLGKLPLR